MHSSGSYSLPRMYSLGRGHWRLAVLRAPGCSPPCGHLSAGWWQGGGPGAEHPGPADEPQAWEKGQLVVCGRGWGVSPSPPAPAVAPQMHGGLEPPLGLLLPICEELARRIGEEGDTLAPGPGVHCGLALPASG